MKTLYIYDKGLKTRQYSLKTLKQLARSKKKFWLDIVNPKEKDLTEIHPLFDLHSLTIEDCITTKTRPKVEFFKKHCLIIAYGVQRKKGLRLTESNFLISKNGLITTSQKPIKSHEALKKNKERLKNLLKKGPDYLTWGLIDGLIDNMHPTFDAIDGEVDNIAKKVLKDPKPIHLSELIELRRELFHIRKVASPQRDMLIALAKNESPFIGKEMNTHFRDLYDHMIRINDIIENLREIIASNVEIHLSVSSNRLNEIMKVLTIIATIMLPLTAIGSVYGMNFKYMPELHWRYGYFIVLGVMGLIALLMLAYFKRKKWI